MKRNFRSSKPDGLSPVSGEPAEISKKPLLLGPQMTQHQAALLILERQRSALAEHLEGAIEGRNPEHLHDLRVASRRARFAFRLFRGALGLEFAGKMRAELRWMARSVGIVRDYDVLLERLQRELALTGAGEEQQAVLHRLVEDRRRPVQQELVQILRSSRFGKLLTEMERLPRRRSRGPEAGVALEEAARNRLWKAARPIHRLRKADPGSFSPEELHRLRIAFKGLRYTAEFFRDLFPEAAAGIRTIIQFQDCLGGLQDCQTGITFLSGLTPAAEKLGSHQLLALGEVIQVERETERKLRQEFVSLWSRHRKEWRTFRGKPVSGGVPFPPTVGK